MTSKPNKPTSSGLSTVPDPTLLAADTSVVSANATAQQAPAKRKEGSELNSHSVSGDANLTKSCKRAKNHSTSQTPTIPLPRSSWMYIHLRLTSLSPNPADLDMLTARTYLSAALAQFLGHTGAAIPMDILRADEAAQEIWVRVPREDGSAVVAACGGWTSSKNNVGWRIKSWGNRLGTVVYGGKDGGLDLFRGGSSAD